jgi:hypothetical protein
MRRPAEGLLRMQIFDDTEFLQVPSGVDLGDDKFRVTKIQLF